MLVVTALTAAGLSAPSAAQVTIDSFTTTQAQLAAPPTAASSVTTGGTDILGSERDLEVERTSGTGTASAQVTGGGLDVSVDASSSGEIRVQWDGADSSATLVPNGLGAVDLTGGSTQNALRVTVDSATAGVVILVTVYTDGTQFSRTKLVMPALAAPRDFIVPFNDFADVGAPGADFSNVGAVTLEISATGGATDSATAQISEVATFSTAAAAAVTATKVDALLIDNDSDSAADPGDTLAYTIEITSTGGTATSVELADTLEANLSLVGGSIMTTPLAIDDAYTSLGNVGISVPVGNGVLGNDTDPDGVGPVLTVSASDMVSLAGGAVSVAGDGSFTYAPPAGFQGTDTFSYTLADGEGGTDSATVKIDVSNLIWFIDNSAAGGNVGTFADPFQSIGAFNSSGLPGAGNNIYLAETGTNYSTGIDLLDAQTLVGEGATGANLGAVLGITVPPHTPMLPPVGGTNPVIDSSDNGVDLAQNNTIRGLSIGNTPAAATGISGTNFGAATISDVGVGGSGGIMNLNTGTASFTFDSLESTSSSGTPVIDINGVGGSMSVTNGAGTDTSISGAATGIDITNSTGSASFSFADTSVSSSSTGVNLASSGSATFTFDSLSITTTNSNGLDADSSGTLNVTGSGNTVTSGTATAVRIKDTTIGASGVTFRSISSSGGSATGIILDNTGTTAGLTVTGDGSTAASGGTIASKSGGDGSTTTGIGIFLNNTMSPSFSFMQLNGFSNFAIRGTTVTGFTLANSVINGVNGSSTAANEGSVSFDDLLGSASFTNNTIEGGLEDNVVVINDTGTLDRMTVSGGTIGLNSTASGNDGISVESRLSSTLKLSVLGTTFTGARGDMVQCNAVDNSTLDCVIRDNTFNNTHTNIVSGGGGVTISGGGATANINLTYDVSGSTAGAQTIRGPKGFAITANAVTGAGTMTGTIRNNHIGVPGVPGSGSSEGGGILAAAAGTVTHTVTIDGNRVRRIGLGGGTASGVDIVANVDNPGGLRPQMNATVTNNDVAELEGTGGFAGMNLTVAGNGTENGILCVEVRNNEFDASGGSTAGNAVFLSQFNAASNYNFPGYTGSPNGEFAFACAVGTASADLGTFLTTTNGNTLINGPFPFPAGTGVSATSVCGVSGTGTSCP